MFEGEDVPSEEHWTARKTLAVQHFNAGDLAYLMTLQGRQNHGNSKCILCDSNEFKHTAHEGNPYNHQRLQEEVALYKEANNDNSLLNKEDLEALQARSKACCAISGIKGFDALLPAIPIEHTVPPVLHMPLGAGNDLIKAIRDIVQTAELDNFYIRTKRAECTSAQDQLFKNKADLATYLEIMEPCIKSLMENIKQYNSIAKTELTKGWTEMQERIRTN